jgi:protein-S-isoprenylcysteine O-methyltransferase Ste14
VELYFKTPLGSVRRGLTSLSWESVMWVRGIVGLVLSLTGILWILQGTNVVHGSGMSGHSAYTVLGVVVLLIGVALLAWAWRIRGRQLN